MYERISNCPLCGSEHFQNHIICNDFLVSQESFVIVKCDQCSFEFTNPRPKSEVLGDYYQSASYISHSNKITGLTDIVYRTARYFALKKKLRLINKYHTKKSILDYGCGTGAFLNVCKKAGWEVTGVELDSKARSIAEGTTKSKISDALINIESDTRFEVITLWHVLEHVSDINEIIDQLKQKLAKGGKLIVAVPNKASYDRQLYKEHWAAYDVPRHLYHFDQPTMKQMMKKHQLKLIDTIPMKLDAYYVSLLSEQHLKSDHKNHGNKYYNSIVNGYKSNTYAKNNDNNYSSLIYVFKK